MSARLTLQLAILRPDQIDTKNGPAGRPAGP